MELEEAPHETSYTDNIGQEDFNHHHEPHFEKTITVVRKVPEPYAVEKTVHIPIYKNVPYAVEVPVAEPFPM